MATRQVAVLLDLTTGAVRVFDDQPGAVEDRDITIATSQRARTDARSGGIPPRSEEEFTILFPLSIATI